METTEHEGVLSRAQDHFQRFHDSLQPTMSPAATWVSLGVVVLSFLAFALIAPMGFELGDGPLYAEYIKNADLSYAPKHIAYYATGILFTRVIPLPLDQTLNLMSALFAATCLGLISAITWVLTGRIAGSIAAVAVAASTYMFATNAVNAEVYVLQLALILAAAFFVLRDKAIMAGIAFGLAFLTSPSTILVVPFLVVLRPSPRFLLRWLLVGGALSALALIGKYSDFLWGAHGVLNMPAANITAAGGLSKEMRELGEYGVSLALILMGLVAIALKPAQRVLLAAAALLWLPSLLIGERYSDVPVQMPFYAILAVFAGYGFVWLSEVLSGGTLGMSLASLAVVVAVAVTATPSYQRVIAEAEQTDEYRAAVMAIANECGDNDIVVAPFATSRLCQHYLDGSPLKFIDDEALAGENGAQDQASSQQLLASTVESGGRVWLPGEFDPSASAFFESNGYALQRFETIFVAVPAR